MSHQIRYDTDHLREDGRWLQRMMEDMYAGRSVRTQAEFQTDVDTLRRASGALDDFAGALDEDEAATSELAGEVYSELGKVLVKARELKTKLPGDCLLAMEVIIDRLDALQLKAKAV